MEQGDFWKLFAETGEPVYWLLCRAGNQAGQNSGVRPESQTPPASAPPALQ